MRTKFTAKELTNLFEANEKLALYANTCSTFKTEIEQIEKKKEESEIRKLFDAYQSAKKEYDKAVFNALHTDKDFNECSTLAVTNGVRELSRHYSINAFEIWFEANQKEVAFDIASVANVVSVVQKLFESFKIGNEEAKIANKKRKSLAEKKAELLARLAEIQAEENAEKAKATPKAK